MKTDSEVLFDTAVGYEPRCRLESYELVDIARAIEERKKDTAKISITVRQARLLLNAITDRYFDPMAPE